MGLCSCGVSCAAWERHGCVHCVPTHRKRNILPRQASNFTAVTTTTTTTTATTAPSFNIALCEQRCTDDSFCRGFVVDSKGVSCSMLSEALYTNSSSAAASLPAALQCWNKTACSGYDVQMVHNGSEGVYFGYTYVAPKVRTIDDCARFCLADRACANLSLASERSDAARISISPSNSWSSACLRVRSAFSKCRGWESSLSGLGKHRSGEFWHAFHQSLCACGNSRHFDLASWRLERLQTCRCPGPQIFPPQRC